MNLATRGCAIDINSLALAVKFNLAIFELISRIDILGVSYECQKPHWWLAPIVSGNALVSTAKGHCLNQCWPSSMMPCGAIRPQWVKFALLLKLALLLDRARTNGHKRSNLNRPLKLLSMLIFSFEAEWMHIVVNSEDCSGKFDSIFSLLFSVSVRSLSVLLDRSQWDMN